MNDTIEKAEKLCDCIKGIVNPARIAIIMSLKDGEKRVGDIESSLQASQSSVSQHLGAMFTRGVLKRRRDGTQIFYSISDKRIFKLLNIMKNIFCDKKRN